MFTAEQLAALEKLVGKPHEGCYELVRFAHRFVGVKLPTDYYQAIQSFRTLGHDEEPRGGDVIVMRNHKILTNHVGIYLGDGRFIHSLEGDGVVISSIHRDPWNKAGRVVGYLRLREFR